MPYEVAELGGANDEGAGDVAGAFVFGEVVIEEAESDEGFA